MTIKAGWLNDNPFDIKQYVLLAWNQTPGCVPRGWFEGCLLLQSRACIMLDAKGEEVASSNGVLGWF